MGFTAKYCSLFTLAFILILPSGGKLGAQTHKIDSLRHALATEKQDTTRYNILMALGDKYQNKNPDTATIYYTQAAAIAGSIKDNIRKGNAIQEIGWESILLGKNKTADSILHFALQLAETSSDIKAQKLKAAVLGNIGSVYYYESNYPQALDYFFKALKMSQELGDKNGQASNLGNIGNVYESESNYPQALDYDFKALKMEEDMGNKEGQASDLGNIGIVYHDESNYPQALDYDFKALKMDEEMGNKNGQAINLGNIGILYARTGKFKYAEDYLKQAIALDSNIGDKKDMQTFEFDISKLYDTTRRYQLALEWFKKASILKDTLFNIDKEKAITRKAMTFQFEHQQDSTKAAQDKIDAIAASDKKRQNVITAAVSVGLILVLIFSVLLFNRFRLTQKQKKLIEKQKEEVEKQKDEVEKKNAVIETQKKLVEEKNKDILDSITYAKRLQDAILPPLSIIRKYFSDSFLLYKPKDIVAGDFYWMEKLDDVLLIAACDCTGHGVPGAMVSVVCSNALNRALKEFKIRDTGKLLDKVRELVLDTFGTTGEVKDGMDCSLCAINTKTGETEWSGAYNPLWYIENGELKELAPDKQPIGKHDNPKPFTTRLINLQKGATLFLFTDGYADQFGGPKGKKFKYKQLEELILAQAAKPMEEQKSILEHEFERWKGEQEQTDDVCVIGIRI